MSNQQTLQNAAYISLATFRKSGVAVATAVWCAGDGNALYIFSADQAGKVKRLRNSNKAQVAVCDARGKLLGDWVDATAELVSEPAMVTTALAALRKKYGWQMWLADVGARLAGKFSKRAYIRVQLDR